MPDVGVHERWVSVAEAAALLSKSERTIRRRVADNKLAHRREGRRLLVKVSGIEPASSDTLSLREQVVTLAAQVDKLTALVEQLTGERDYLRGALAEALQLRRAALEPPKRRGSWWPFGKRED